MHNEGSTWSGLFSGQLAALPTLSGVVTRQISAENPTGAKGGACRWDPNPDDPNLPHSFAARHLGRGWKVRPFIQIEGGATATLAEIEGPGCINEFFITSNLPRLRELVLRIYWDDEATPSVECPLGDFFAMGHDTGHLVNSMPVVVGPDRAFSSYWQMPFRRHARVTLENQGQSKAEVVAYRILYKLHPVPEDVAYFHAQWRRAVSSKVDPQHVILDGVAGRGLYVGTYLAWTALSSRWWGEGEVKFFIDGDDQFPTMADNGTEDYFGGAWGFGVDRHAYMPDTARNPALVETVFQTPYLGLSLARSGDVQAPRAFSMHRWHILDAIGFSEDLRVTVQTLGWWPDGDYKPLTDDIASVAYWYQVEPHTPFAELLPRRDRLSR